MQAKSLWTGGLRFVNEADSGHAFVTEAPGADGRSGAPTPMEIVLAGLAACSGVDVVSILTRMRIPLRGLEVTAEAERAEKHPRVFTGIRLKYRVQGEVPARKLERAIALSSRTYCSVGAMLGTTAAIEHEYEILPEDPE